MADPIWLERAFVLAMHAEQIKEHRGPEGIRDEVMLDSALARPLNLAAYGAQPPDILALAAAYAFGIVRNHPFVDGNKRTGCVACLTFLSRNGLEVIASDDALTDVFLKFAAGEIGEDDLRDWLATNCKPA